MAEEIHVLVEYPDSAKQAKQGLFDTKYGAAGLRADEAFTKQKPPPE